jgi:SAM-dependent methyltransferase
MKRRFQIAFLRSQGLRPEHRLLDLGCGTLRGGIPIIEYLEARRYTGIEVRADVLALAREELKDDGLEIKQPTLLVAEDLTELSIAPFDFIWAFSVLIHMDDEIARGCLEFVARHLDFPGGAFFANVNLGERPPGGWQDFPVLWRPLSFYESMAEAVGLTVRAVGMLRLLGHVSGEPVSDQQQMLRFAPAADGG